MTRRKRAQVVLRIAIFVLIAGLGVLFLAAVIMSRTYESHGRDDDASLTTSSALSPSYKQC